MEYETKKSLVLTLDEQDAIELLDAIDAAKIRNELSDGFVMLYEALEDFLEV